MQGPGSRLCASRGGAAGVSARSRRRRGRGPEGARVCCVEYSGASAAVLRVQPPLTTRWEEKRHRCTKTASFSEIRGKPLESRLKAAEKTWKALKASDFRVANISTLSGSARLSRISRKNKRLSVGFPGISEKGAVFVRRCRFWHPTCEHHD